MVTSREVPQHTALKKKSLAYDREIIKWGNLIDCNRSDNLARSLIIRQDSRRHVWDILVVQVLFARVCGPWE